MIFLTAVAEKLNSSFNLRNAIMIIKTAILIYNPTKELSVYVAIEVILTVIVHPIIWIIHPVCIKKISVF